MKTDKIENYADLLRAKADVIDSIRYNVKDCNENIDSLTKELEVWNSILEYLIK